MNTLREDRWAIKRLHEKTPDIAHRWARAPLFDLRNFARQNLETIRTAVEQNSFAPQVLEHAPFMPLALLIPALTDDSAEPTACFIETDTDGQKHLFSNASATHIVTAACKVKHLAVFKTNPPVIDPESVCVGAMYYFDTLGKLVNDMGVSERIRQIGDDDFNNREFLRLQTQLNELTAAIAIGLLDLLSRCDQHQVLVTPSVPESSDRKTAALKPWLRLDAPRIILLDPTTARQYGHGLSRGGTHASPRIHQRRGHWHTLRAERFKHNDDGTPRRAWVKPTWVGEREWEYQGNTYRVLTPEPAEVAP